MKFLNKPLLAATCAAIVASSAVFTSSAHADLTAAAGVASAYYWRGLQVSNGAQVWGEATYTLDSGFYGDLWASSEGFGVGPEYDLTAGWSGKFGDLGVNVGAITYIYSRDHSPSQPGAFDDNDPGDFSDAFVKLSFGDAFGGIYYNIAQAQSQAWAYAGYTIGKFTPSIGYQQFKDVSQTHSTDDKWDYTYIDLTFAATKNLNFIVSSVVAHTGDSAAGFNQNSAPPTLDTNRAKVIVSYTLPIEM
jgi:hypothetical protein